MPSVKACDAFCLISGSDGRLVECGVGRVFERRALQTLVIVDGSVADELYLRYARDGLEVWMEDGFLGRLGLVVPMPI